MALMSAPAHIALNNASWELLEVFTAQSHARGGAAYCQHKHQQSIYFGKQTEKIEM